MEGLGGVGRLECLDCLCHGRGEHELVVGDHLRHFAAHPRPLALHDEHAALVELARESRSPVALHPTALRGDEAAALLLVVLGPHDGDALEGPGELADGRASEGLGCCHPADVAASLERHDLHDDDRVNELVDVGGASEDNCASVGDGEDLLLASD
eukprot:760952-Hanusia_phi.AAC.1